MQNFSNGTKINIFGLLIFAFFSATVASGSVFFDYDRQADLAVFRSSTGRWHTYSSENQSLSEIQWGYSTDILAPADYDGDGLTDFAVWRPENGNWYIYSSRTQDLFAIQWGATSQSMFGSIQDIPVQADYDGDGQADIAVWRPENGTWYVLTSNSGYSLSFARYFQFGQLGDVPVPADYDGDDKTDYAVFRSSENRWYINLSKTGQFITVEFEKAGDNFLVPADYTGDGIDDIAVFDKGTWLIRRSEDGETETYSFGLQTDRPVPADYDGDGKTDVAVYRGGTWFIRESSTSNLRVYNYGVSTDTPVTSGIIKQSIVPIP